LRVLVFLLMATVAVSGSLYGYRLITGKDLISLSELGVGSSAPRKVEITITPTPTPAPPTATSTRVPATATPVPDKPQVMAVGNTDGLGVYLRRTPRNEDKVRSYMDGARMEITGPPEEAEGRRWFKVRASDGTEGYIPAEFLVNLP